jgi:hypothetical protein
VRAGCEGSWERRAGDSRNGYEAPRLGKPPNVFAALPWALLVYSFLVMAATIGSPFLRRVRPQPIVLLGTRSSLQKPVLAAIRELPPLPDGTTIYTFGHPTEIAPEIYVFAKVYDLGGAARIELGDPTADAFPIASPVQLSCERSRVVPNAVGTHLGPSQGARYGRFLFLDVPRRRWSMISSHREYLAAVPRYLG